MRRWLHRLLLPAAAAGILAAGLSASAPARASVTPIGQQGCEDGQVVGGSNAVRNGDFRISAGPGPDIAPEAGFTSELINRGPGIYPNDYPQIEGDSWGGGFSIQSGTVAYRSEEIVGRPFLGDPSREVQPSQTYFYSNPFLNRDGTPFFEDATPEGGYLWRQTVPVLPNTLYNFYAYFDNLLNPGSDANDPVIELRVDDPADPDPAVTIGSPIAIPKTPDTWVPIELTFLTGPTQNQAVLEIWDVTGRFVLAPDTPTRGDDFGMTGINLRPCAAAVGVAKAVDSVVANNDGSYNITYTITIENYGVGLAPVANLQVVDDLAKTFADAGSFQVVARSSSPNVTINPNFTGVAPNTNLLSGADTLAPGDSATITFTVRITLGAGLRGRGPFVNRATVTATWNNIAIQDDSVPGTVPDIDGNTNPKDPTDNGDTVVNIGSKVGIPLIIQP